MLLLGVSQEVAKKETKAFPLGSPLPPAVLTMNGGAFAFASVLHLGRIYHTPKMGLLLAKKFAFPFCLKFVQAGVRST